jgi:cytochrome c6
MPTTQFRRLAMVAVTLLLLAGCGGGADTNTGGETTASAGATATATGEVVAGGVEGDVEHGRVLFNNVGCALCHALADAEATGTRGPDLDQVKPSYEQVVQCVSYGTVDGVMPSFLDRKLEPSDIKDLAAYVSEATNGTTSNPEICKSS